MSEGKSSRIHNRGIPISAFPWLLHTCWSPMASSLRPRSERDPSDHPCFGSAHLQGQGLDCTIRFSLCWRRLSAFINVGLISDQKHERTWFQHRMGHLLQQRPIEAVSTACRTILLLLSAHTHGNCGLHLWGMSGKRACRAKIRQKSVCSFASHGCFSLLRSYTSLWSCLLPNSPHELQ